MNMIYGAVFGLFSVLALLVPKEGFATGAPQDQSFSSRRRVLPIRGQDLLEEMRLQAPYTDILSVSFSPAGAHIAAMIKRIGVGHAGKLELLLIDAHDGRARKLSGLNSDLAGWLSSQPSWSADGTKLAMVDREGDGLAVVLWDVKSPDTPIRLNVPAPANGDLDVQRIVRWHYWFETNRLLVQVEPALSDMRPRAAHGTEEHWTWIYSQERRLAEGPLDTSNSDSSSRHARLLEIGLNDGTSKDLGSINNYGALADCYWTVDYRLSRIFLCTRDFRSRMRDDVTRSDGPAQMWHIRNGDARGARLSNMQSYVLSIAPREFAVDVIYEGGAGEVGSFGFGDDDKFLVEEIPDLTVWPLISRYAVLKKISRSGDVRIIPGEPIGLRTSVYPSSQKNHVVAWTGYQLSVRSYRTGDILEIDTVTGNRIKLNPPGMSVSGIDVAPDGASIVAILQSVGRPPEIAIWQSQTRSWTYLTRLNEKYQPLLGQGSPVWFTWASGDKKFSFSGIVVKPLTMSATYPAPLLVCMNGGYLHASGRVDNRFNLALQFGIQCSVSAHVFANAGYVVFIPNHRQTSGIGYEENLSAIGHFGDQIGLDVEAGIDQLIRDGIVDKDRVAITGVSGGSDDVAYAISKSNRYRAALIDDGPLAFHQIHVPEESISRWGGSEFPGGIARKMFGYDPVEHPPINPFMIYTPLFLRIAGLDEFGGSARHRGLVDNSSWGEITRQSFYLFAYALERNNVPFDAIIDRDSHGIRNYTYILEYQSRMLQWLDYFVKGEGENPIPAMESPFSYKDYSMHCSNLCGTDTRDAIDRGRDGGKASSLN